MQTQGEDHCVLQLDVLLWECEPVAVCLLIKSCNFYTRYVFFLAFSLMRGVLFSTVMPMPHVTKGIFWFVSLFLALFLLQRLTIQRWRWKRKEGKRMYSFRFSLKRGDSLLNIVSVFCFWLWFMCATFFMLKFNREADNINTASKSHSQIHSKQQ